MVDYYPLGGQRRINEIVYAGSHDAAITKGGGNAKTQGLNIGDQANAGVRIFDLRIAGHAKKLGIGGAKLQAFHADPAFQKSTGRAGGLDTTRLLAGTWGMNLDAILAQATAFVTGSNEFLILKFDKCTNWGAIADECRQVCGNALYDRARNLNLVTQDDLKGKVVALFADKAFQALGNKTGIHGFKNLAGGGAYDANYDGLQYHGKGGTSAAKPSHYIQENYDKQKALMKTAASGNPDVVGMMYWTTTGLFGDIKKRNRKMWKDRKRPMLEQLFQDGMGDEINDRIPNGLDAGAPANAGVCRRFIPNFVMVDFADVDKCRYIYELNALTNTELAQVMAGLADDASDA